MLVKSDRQQNTLILTLSGVIDEQSNFDDLLTDPHPAEIHVRCSGVDRIRSIGIAKWRHFFHSVRCEGINLKFFEIAPAIMDQLNYVIGLIEVEEIQSVIVPFTCEKCSAETLRVYQRSEVMPHAPKVLKAVCSKCKEPVELLNADQEYFSFLPD